MFAKRLKDVVENRDPPGPDQCIVSSKSKVDEFRVCVQGFAYYVLTRRGVPRD